MVEVRPATPADAALVGEIARESWHAAYDDVLGADVVDETVDDWYAVEELEVSIADASDREEVAFPIAETGARGAGDARTVGFAHAGPSRDDPDAAHLVRLYVRPDAWGEGVGTALLERVETSLEDRFSRIELEVFAENEVGVGFYESRDFDLAREHEETFGGEDHLVYEYEKRLATDGTTTD